MYIFNAVQLLSYAVFVQEILQMISLLTIYNFWSFWLKVKRRKTIPAECNDYCLLFILLITLVFHQSIKLIYSSINMFDFYFRNSVKVLFLLQHKQLIAFFKFNEYLLIPFCMLNLWDIQDEWKVVDVLKSIFSGETEGGGGKR